MDSMRLHELGSSGLRVSRVGLGCNNFGRRLDLDGTRVVVDAALAEGITFLDTAESYGDGNSERFLGEVLEGRRAEVVLATKFGWNADQGGSRDYMRRAIAGSLERLRTDAVDLYYYHRPDGVTPIADTIEAMTELFGEGMGRAIGGSKFSVEQLDGAVKAGAGGAVVRASGVSNFSVEQLDEAVKAGPVAALQNRYNLLERDAEAGVLPRCAELGVGFIPYFPLASGLLTG